MHGLWELTISLNFFSLSRLVGRYEVVQLVRSDVAPTSYAELEPIVLIARRRGKVIDDIAQRMIPLGVGYHP
jgi:hypothetical protein